MTPRARSRLLDTAALSPQEALSERDREAQVQAAMAARMIDWSNPVLDGEVEKVFKRAFAIFDRGEPLEPQLAVQLWAEIYAFQRLRTVLGRMVKHGEKVAERTPIKL
jgi:hypothetical protein